MQIHIQILMLINRKDLAYRAGDECEKKESLVTEVKLRRIKGRNLRVCDLCVKDVVVLKKSFV